MKWLHYVGGFYTPDKLIAEAKAHGVSRRVAARVAGAMSFGDTIQLLHWNGGEPYAFAEFTVDWVSMDSRISQELANQLVSEGKAYLAGVQESPQLIVRECGSYVLGSCWIVDVSLREVVKQAIEIAKAQGIKLALMVGGHLSWIYDPVLELDPAPCFTRGFIRVDGVGVTESIRLVQAIEDYRIRTHVKRRDVQVAV